jgi:uncharacterized protein YndB with AHSA1/START domain
MTGTRHVKLDQYLAHPPATVWRAITQPELVARWWVAGDIRPSVGHRFLLEMPGWGNITCEVIEADEPERFAYTFGDWTLTWELVAEGHGTRLLLTHDGFDLDNPTHRFAFDNMGPGWRDEVLPKLSALLDELA